MTEELDLRLTIVPKSDQLNADDLMFGPITVTVTKVTQKRKAEQPLAIDISGGHKPYKPCKSMIRCLIAAWGIEGRWNGNSMTLFRDPAALWQGKEVGGIRVSHASGLDGPLSVMLTVRRGVKEPYTIQPLILDRLPDYTEEQFLAKQQGWAGAIKDDKIAPEKLIANISEKFTLSEAMIDMIMDMKPTTPEATNEED